MEVSETWVLEVDGYQFLYLSSEQWIWAYSVRILCTDGVCLDEPFSLKRPKTLLSLSVKNSYIVSKQFKDADLCRFHANVYQFKSQGIKPALNISLEIPHQNIVFK